VALAIGLFFAAGSAMAGAKIKISDDSNFDLGMRVQALWFATDDELDSADSGWEDFDDFRIRRARLRLKANVTKWVTAFMQSDVANGADHKIIDAWIKLNLHPWASLIMGENMAPTQRTNLTSSGGLMTIDRPGLANKNLTWGMNTRTRFNNSSDSNNAVGANLAVVDTGSAPDAVRDNGITLFGSGSLQEMLHLKYYLGYYDGLQGSSGTLTRKEDDERITARVQLNYGDPEPGYFGLGTYVGKKKTMAIGFFYDAQDSVGTYIDPTGAGSPEAYDYSEWGVDIFAEQPIGPGSLTFDAQYTDLDLDGSNPQSEGDGFYVQAGYFINNWQPWVMYEQWDSEMDATDASNFLGSSLLEDRGTIDTFRIGLTYFIKGHNANIKIGYEKYSSDEDIISGEDDLSTFLIGWYMTY
jgi:hypothetical protein